MPIEHHIIYDLELLNTAGERVHLIEGCRAGFMPPMGMAFRVALPEGIADYRVEKYSQPISSRGEPLSNPRISARAISNPNPYSPSDDSSGSR